MSVEQTNISVKVDSDSSGIIAVLLSFFFGCFGFFFATWLVGKWGFIKSLLVSIVFFIFLLLGFFLPVIGWFIILPVTYIVMLIVAYKSCQNHNVEIKMPTIEKTTNQS